LAGCSSPTETPLASTVSSVAPGSSSDAPGSSSDPAWDAVVEKAKQEGSVNFYTGFAEDTVNEMVKAFNAKYPDIQVNVTRGGADILQRVDAEIAGKTDGADVMTFATDSWFLDHADSMAAIDTPEAESWPVWIKDGTLPTVFYNAAGFLVWNTTLVPDGLDGWEELVKSPDVENVAMYNTGGAAAMAGIMDMLESKFGEDYLTQLGKKTILPYTSSTPADEAVASGEASVAIIGSSALAQSMKDSGAPVDFAYPDPTYAVTQIMGVLKKSTRPNAALVFANFLLSKDGQTPTAEKGWTASPKYDDIAGSLDPSKLYLEQDAKFTPDFLAKWEARYTDVFGS
jgi:ABC-type Fe3+ transport system substrate-binding protein